MKWVVVAALLTGCHARLDLGRDVERVWIGPRIGCVEADDGRVRCAGLATRGALATPTATLTESCAGEPCSHFYRTFTNRADDVAIGDAFVCVLDSGIVSCAGSNRFGELGRGTRDGVEHADPIAVDLPERADELVAGRFHACARLESGEVRCWGAGSHGELGVDPSTLADCGTPTDTAEAMRLDVAQAASVRCSASPIAGFGIARDLRAGPHASCALVPAARCSGRNVDGALGTVDSTDDVFSPSPLRVANVVDLALGFRHGVALDARGWVFVYGRDDVGQLGLSGAAPDDCGGAPCARTPIRMSDVEDVRAVSAGDRHTCVVSARFDLACAGSDARGQLGNSEGPVETCGGEACSRALVDVLFVSPVDLVRSSGDSNLVVARDGHAYAFGDNAYGQFGSAGAATFSFAQVVYGVDPP